MEGYIYKWTNIISGFKPRYALIKDGKLELSAFKDDPSKKIYDLSNCILLEEKKNHFSIEIKEKKISFKTYSEYEKTEWIKAINQSKAFNNNIDDRMSINSKEMSSNLLNSLYAIQNNVFDLNLAINSFHQYISNKGKKKKDDELLLLYEKFLSIKQNLRSSLDETIQNVVDFNSKIVQKTEQFYEASEIKQVSFKDEIINEIKNSNKNFNDELKEEDVISGNSSFEDCLDIANTEINFGLCEIRNLEKKISSVKIEKTLFDSYTHEKRKKLTSIIKSSNSMISDLVKSLMKERPALPISYNEPLSMLQRQIESFQFFDLLEKVHNNQEIEFKLANIAGFIVADISLNINRLLKPFNPILGETYEYIDVNNKFRSISEQVSHHPAISAFFIESPHLTIYGDSKFKQNMLFFKGALEMNFISKTHIIVHKTNKMDINTHNMDNVEIIDSKENYIHHFVFNKPKFLLKGMVYGTPHYAFTGEIIIEDILNKENSNVKLVLNFIEESKGDLIEGKIFKNKEVVYILKGSWKESLNLYDKSGSKLIKEIWRINNNENYIKNTDCINNYLLSEYAYDLNNLTKELESILPKTDSRFRPDQRKYEIGKVDEAEELKKKLEDKQRLSSKLMEKNKIVYKPNYFELKGDESGTFYIPSRNYWIDREKSDFNHLADIFTI